MSLSTALTARKVGIDTYRENVVYLRRDCPVYRAEGFQALSKVAVRANGTTILAVLNVVDDERIVGELELVITGWVAMWRPLEVLLYDWWPLIDERRQVRRILSAPISIRYDG
jgi:hypothetical protein